MKKEIRMFYNAEYTRIQYSILSLCYNAPYITLHYCDIKYFTIKYNNVK